MTIFYSCRQAHELLSQALDRRLGLVERTRLQVHLSICRSCTHFKGQMGTLRQSMQTWSHQAEEQTSTPPTQLKDEKPDKGT